MQKAVLLFLLSVQFLLAVDIIKLAPGQSSSDHRQAYADKLLIHALEKTIDEYGPYTVEYTTRIMNRNRTLIELKKGEIINVHETATRAEWEEQVLTVRIPTRKGLMGYRIFLIHSDNKQKFVNLKTIDEVKKLKAGLRRHWSITKVMDTLGFSIVTSPNYGGLFHMLDYKRFDYFSRGINEIYDEYNTYKDSFPELEIEQSVAVYIATPNYFFISPSSPKLHKRIKKGLEKMLADGSFDSLFIEYHKESIERANLQNRQIFFVNNPLLTEETPLDSLDYWYLPKGVKGK